ncbi:MAG: hypothetical protein IK048_03525 [Clostridia bacterium]|nr:hypothetical protein [Clostridia bacterium]
MTRFQKKCETYNDDVEAVRKIIKSHKVIAYFPMTVLILLGIALTILTFVKHSVSIPWVFLVISAVGILYMLIINSVLRNKFKKHNQSIVAKFVEYYAPQEIRMPISIVGDNKGIKEVVNKYGVNPLFVFVSQDSLCFITSKMFDLTAFELRTPRIGEWFENTIRMDFGKLIIPVVDIDNYRDDQMMVNFKDSVLKVDFADHKFMDYFIPKKDFYFNVNKK